MLRASDPVDWLESGILTQHLQVVIQFMFLINLCPAITSADTSG